MIRVAGSPLRWSISDRKPKVITATIYLASATACEMLLGPLHVNLLDGFHNLSDATSILAGVVAPLVFLIASVRVFFDLRFGYLGGLIAALLAWPWFYQWEFSNYRFLNSWVVFNLPDYFLHGGFLWLELKILAIVLLVLATLCSLIRLAPARWIVGQVPVRKRTWPVFAIGLLIVAAWYSSAVIPYRIPAFDLHSNPPNVNIIHLERNGIHFHETQIAVFRDGRFFITRAKRRLFQYRIAGVVSSGVVPEEAFLRMNRVFGSPEFAALSRPCSFSRARPNPPRILKFDWWYIFVERPRCRLASTADSSKIPEDLLKWLDDPQSFPTLSVERRTVGKDICFGFCFDPFELD